MFITSLSRPLFSGLVVFGVVIMIVVIQIKHTMIKIYLLLVIEADQQRCVCKMTWRTMNNTLEFVYANSDEIWVEPIDSTVS